MLSPAQFRIKWKCSAVSGQVLERMWKEEVMPRTDTGMSGAYRGRQKNLIQDSQFSGYCLNNETSRIRRRLHHTGSKQLPKFCVLTDPKNQKLFTAVISRTHKNVAVVLTSKLRFRIEGNKSQSTRGRLPKFHMQLDQKSLQIACEYCSHVNSYKHKDTARLQFYN